MLIINVPAKLRIMIEAKYDMYCSEYNSFKLTWFFLPMRDKLIIKNTLTGASSV